MIDVKVIFLNTNNTWSKIIQDTNGNGLEQETGLILLPEQNNKEYFDGWENQIRQFPNYNVVEVERFI